MAKKPLVIVFSPVGTLTRTYIARPDDKAPEGAKFKPDGKYKTGIVLADLGDVEKTVLDFARAEFGKSYPGDDVLQTPWRAGGDEGSEIILTAKSQFQPVCVDSKGQRMPEGVFAGYGDKARVKVSLYSYSKSEKVKVNGRLVDETVFGVSARLLAVQVIEKSRGGAGGGDEGFGEVEGGYIAPEAAPVQAQAKRAAAPTTAGAAHGSDF